MKNEEVEKVEAEVIDNNCKPFLVRMNEEERLYIRAIAGTNLGYTDKYLEAYYNGFTWEKEKLRKLSLDELKDLYNYLDSAMIKEYQVGHCAVWE